MLLPRQVPSIIFSHLSVWQFQLPNCSVQSLKVILVNYAFKLYLESSTILRLKVNKYHLQLQKRKNMQKPTISFTFYPHHICPLSTVWVGFWSSHGLGLGEPAKSEEIVFFLKDTCLFYYCLRHRTAGALQLPVASGKRVSSHWQVCQPSCTWPLQVSPRLLLYKTPPITWIILRGCQLFPLL